MQHRTRSVAVHRLVGVGLQRDGVALAVAAVGCDHDLRVGVVDAVDQRLRGEAREHHGVDRADARAGEHRDGQLGDHRQVDADPVALGHALRLEHVGEAPDLGVQVGVGDAAGVARLALPVVGDLAAVTRLDVAVQAVVGDVELAPREPLGEGRVPLQHVVPGLRPAQALRMAGPPGLGVLVRLVVDGFVARQRIGAERLRRRERAVLAEPVLDGWRLQPWGDLTRRSAKHDQSSSGGKARWPPR